eukprot:TRINITY_DN4908_c0_g1_i7.p1 TRINITY_DN4908_c0_g1~~TRINITY_DN4908_c0_g1_i7.p1  ORF type:complete len:220 (+),score=73.30 TRINITY_DN4908_c0_g1_i7:224-883(+)
MDNERPPVFDRSTAAGRAIYNTYHLKSDRLRHIDIGRRHAPPKRENPRPIHAPKPQGKNPAKAKISVPKFHGGPRREFHRIDFVDRRKPQQAILRENNNFEEESAPSLGCVRSSEDRKKELQLKFEYGPEYSIATKKRAAAAAPPLAPRVSATEQALQELTGSISERTEFLEEMKAAGMGDKYDGQIKGEVAQLLKQVAQLEQKLAKEQQLLDAPSDDL